MRFDNRTPRIALRATLAGALALGLMACDQQQKPPAPQQFGESFEILPDKSRSAGGSGAAPRGAASMDIPDPGDMDLASRVRAAITSEPALRTVTVSVDASNGVITLNGTADTHANSDRAARVALDVDGVRSVKNDLIVVRGS
jgi:hypothetical protein